MLWTYKSENIPGNLHSAAAYISSFHPDWDVVAMDFSGSNTVVVYREPRTLHSNLLTSQLRD